VTDAIKYGVFKSGQNITSYTYNSISSSTSSHVFNIAVPSLETVISREVLWESTLTLRIEGNMNGANQVKPDNMFLVNYGVTDALSAFPLHSLVATMTATINNNTVAMNVADVLPAILRLMDPEELAYYNDMTPTTLDYLGDYRDGVDMIDYQIARSTAGNRLVCLTPGANLAVPGALSNPAVAGDFTGTAPQSFISYPNNVLAYDQSRPSGTGKKHRSRGSFRILQIYSQDANGANKRVPRIDDNVVFVQFRVTEPILLSPFTFGNQEGKQGFYGIQTLNFQMNLLSNGNRAWRSVRLPGNGADLVKNVTVDSFQESKLIFQFLTPHASELLPSRNTVPYYELPVYRTTGLSVDIPSRGGGSINAQGVFTAPETRTLNSANIQLSGIPDKLIIFVRKAIGNRPSCEPDTYLTIRGIRINFNNQAGLLSSMSQQQLYTNSLISGLNNMSYDEFTGLTMSVSGRGNDVSASWQPYSGIGARRLGAGNDPGFKYIPTTGSMLVLNFGEVIQLTDEYYAPGSLGTFNLQLQLDVENNHKVNWLANEIELVIIPLNSGIFINERGTSSTFISLLTKQDVLSSLEQQPYTSFEIKRMVGGSSFSDNLRNGLRWLWQKTKEVAPGVMSQLGTTAKGALMSSGNPYGVAAGTALNALGYGRSGGHRSLQDRTN
jgi:hypothetical protein